MLGRSLLEGDADAELKTVGAVQEVGSHVETGEHLADFFEFAEVVSRSDPLIESAHVFCKTDSLECVHSACYMKGKCVVMQVLNQVH